ncbi:hypothetical protein C922_05392 [Plasmodium inui San Antonio 1]|uniref:Uncharacterized protein n=1 Tax=Plasmodium inui San Antonio 1 TaxID=1237626 RepID=W7AG07_9APIC|nr:hypothetical protein C922_05392 [Plasmodium inui San Antonio 1]EUD64226.1 hypothetical protein C922_05392 [Plasmodium inui San Antonio 1]
MSYLQTQDIGRNNSPPGRVKWTLQNIRTESGGQPKEAVRMTKGQPNDKEDMNPKMSSAPSLSQDRNLPCTHSVSYHSTNQIKAKSNSGVSKLPGEQEAALTGNLQNKNY